MSFLNAILLAGAAAFTIPLLIHLLNKRRVHTISWGAMHLLQQAINLRRRNLNLEQKLLLAVRIAIPIVLALCLARPVFNLIRQLPGLNKTSLVVLLDDSVSMRAPLGTDNSENTNKTSRDQAIAILHRVIDQLPKGSDVTVILAGNPPRLLLDGPTTDHELIFEKLNTTPSLGGPINLSQSLQLAASQIQRTLTAARELILISDFQQNDWQAVLDGAPLPDLDPIKQIQPQPSLSFYHIANQGLENLAISQVDTSTFIVARNQPIALRVTIQNHGQRDYQDLPLHLEADGTRIRSTRASIPAGAASTVTLTHAFETAGDHTITIRLEGDSFPDDNTFSLIIPVREQIPTLLVKGRSGNAPMTGPTDFLEIALSPHLSANPHSSFKDVIQTKVIEDNKLSEREIEAQQIIVLANIERLNSKQLEQLEKHIKLGAHLVVFPGPDVDLRWYEESFFNKGKGLLPAQPIGFGHLESNSPPLRLVDQHHTHPATIYFNDARGMSLHDASFTHWQKFAQLPDDVRVILSFENGEPFLIEKTHGKGQILQFATTATAQWSNLPLQSSFVPLMQRLITHLATRNTPAPFLRCGEELQFQLTPQQANLKLHLVDPLNQLRHAKISVVELTEDQLKELKKDTNKKREDLPATISSVHEADTFIPGIYQLRQEAQPLEQNDNTLIKSFAFNPDPRESALQTLDNSQVQSIASRLGATYANDYDTYQKQDRQRRFGAEIWQPVLLLLLLLLFGEVFLQQRIANA